MEWMRNYNLGVMIGTRACDETVPGVACTWGFVDASTLSPPYWTLRVCIVFMGQLFPLKRHPGGVSVSVLAWPSRPPLFSRTGAIMRSFPNAGPMRTGTCLPPCGGNPLSGVTRPPGMSRGRVVTSHATPP